jgi:hypothetical protein
MKFEIEVAATMLSQVHNGIVRNLPAKVRDMFPPTFRKQNALD